MKPLIFLNQECNTDLDDTLHHLQLGHTIVEYDGITVPIANPLLTRPLMSFKRQISREKIFILKLSNNFDCDSKENHIRRYSEHTILQELQRSIIFEPDFLYLTLKSSHNVNLARVINDNLKGPLLIEVPMQNPKTCAYKYRKDIEIDNIDNFEDTWQWWNEFHAYTDYNPKIKLVLDLSTQPPTENALLRWLGEPIEMVILSLDFFGFCNNKPYVLPNHTLLIEKFIENNINFMIRGVPYNQNCVNYPECIRILGGQTKWQLERTQLNFDHFADVLQAPLQPLHDNLNAKIYEVFEKDSVKYIMYQKAIQMALIDKVAIAQIKSKIINVMIVGAGRGPLIRATLNASVNTSRKVKICVVEKNPHAVLTLAALVAEMWSDKNIQIISCDMRVFNPPEKYDILVSELLGSFGDNELSPECLESVLVHLKSDGICIPSEYTNYINPIMSSKLYNAAKNMNDKSKPFSAVQASYVCYLKNVYHIDNPQRVFNFNHSKHMKDDNTRYETLKFNVEMDCVLHGFAGYFDTTLYKTAMLSTHPMTHTQGMFSWFPYYFPMQPQQLKSGDSLTVKFWRCKNKQYVWYEWCTSEPYHSFIHNQNGCGLKFFK